MGSIFWPWKHVMKFIIISSYVLLASINTIYKCFHPLKTEYYIEIKDHTTTKQIEKGFLRKKYFSVVQICAIHTIFLIHCFTILIHCFKSFKNESLFIYIDTRPVIFTLVYVISTAPIDLSLKTFSLKIISRLYFLKSLCVYTCQVSSRTVY